MFKRLSYTGWPKQVIDGTIADIARTPQVHIPITTAGRMAQLATAREAQWLDIVTKKPTDNQIDRIGAATNALHREYGIPYFYDSQSKIIIPSATENRFGRQSMRVQIHTMGALAVIMAHGAETDIIPDLSQGDLSRESHLAARHLDEIYQKDPEKAQPITDFFNEARKALVEDTAFQEQAKAYKTAMHGGKRDNAGSDAIKKGAFAAIGHRVGEDNARLLCIRAIFEPR